ncbi:MAG TPA: hypothetical protein VFP84_07070 [Kofleriaceae bacterium]|nr:hypothetical protein [Kofleriaceae bacterium]
MTGFDASIQTSDSLLELTNNMPQPVFVRFFQAGTDGHVRDVVGFASESGGVYHTEGVHWINKFKQLDSKPDRSDSADVSKLINFVLEKNVLALDCDLHYSPLFSNPSVSEHPSVLMCAPHGQFKAEYHFVVYVDESKFPLPTGARHHRRPSTTTVGGVLVRAAAVDPKIVVTPIND